MTPTPAERAKQLAEDHWQYVEATLKIHGCYEEELKKAAHHYLTAAQHFYLHAVEDTNNGLFRPRIGSPLPPEEVERINRQVAPYLCDSCQYAGNCLLLGCGGKATRCPSYASNLREQIAEAKETESEFKEPDPCLDLVQHLYRQRAFSLNTFGPGPRTKGVIDHITKELKEIEAEPTDLYEWVDLVLLSLDGAWRAGHSPEAIAEAINAKQAKNEARKWPDWRTADPDKAIEHDRSHDGPDA